MTRLVLIRHAHSQANAKGILAGRIEGISLSERGRTQADDLVRRLGKSDIGHIRTSPLQRCQETIEPWLRENQNFDRLNLHIDENLSEVDYGSWSGKKLSSLYRLKLWKIVQERPSAMYFPEGEGLAQMQVRAMRAISESISMKSSGSRVIVSHGDVIKAIIATTLGMHLDQFQRIVIDPASISVLDFDGGQGRVLCLNDSSSSIEEIINSGIQKKVLLGGGSGRSQGRRK